MTCHRVGEIPAWEMVGSAGVAPAVKKSLELIAAARAK
jgi:hypothetical protein